MTWGYTPFDTGIGLDKGEAPHPGWSNIVTNTQNNTPTVFTDGNTYYAWDATLTWEATNGGGIYGAPQSTGCRDFGTGESGRFAVNYTNVPSQVFNTVNVHSYALTTVYLSNGQTLVDNGKTFATPNDRKPVR